MGLYFNLSKDERFLEIDLNNTNMYHLDEFTKQFSKLDDGYYHDPRYKMGMWNGYIEFVKNNRISTGLWLEAQTAANLMGVDIHLNGLRSALDLDLDLEELNRFLDDVASDIKDIDDYRYFQRDAIIRLLQYKFANSEVATSGGKTLVAYSLLLYLKYVKKIIDKDNKFLMIVPRVSLVNQTKEKFIETYKTKYDIKVVIFGGKSKFTDKEYEEADIVISTYQSLARKKKPFFSTFKAVIVDEAHTSINKTITNAINKSINLEYKFGLSGTLMINTKYANYFRLQEVIGPIVHRVPAKELIDNNFSADVDVKIVKLKYKPDDYEYYQSLLELHKKAVEALKNRTIISIKPFDTLDELISTIYSLEKNMIISYEPRINFIVKLTKEINSNTLILFNDVMGGYGKKIHNDLRDSDVESFYIDGDVDYDKRDKFSEFFQKSEHATIVASYGTYSTGIDIPNIKYIIMVESYKSEKLIRQTIGRGMRLMSDGSKSKVIVIDLIDQFGKYSKQQGYARKGIYKSQQFNVETLTKVI